MTTRTFDAKRMGTRLAAGAVLSLAGAFGFASLVPSAHAGTNPADTKPAEVRLVPMLFEVAQDSKDNNNRLDLDQVKQILFFDATGILGGPVADNALWISKLRIEQKPQ